MVIFHSYVSLPEGNQPLFGVPNFAPNLFFSWCRIEVFNLFGGYTSYMKWDTHTKMWVVNTTFWVVTGGLGTLKMTMLNGEDYNEN